MMSLTSLLLEDDNDTLYKNPLMKVKKPYKFYGVSNYKAIQEILSSGVIDASQYRLRTDKAYRANDAVYFTDDLGRAFNWYATKRSDAFNDLSGKDAFVFVINPDYIDWNEVYFDEADFYIAVLGVLIYKMNQSEKLEKKAIETKISVDENNNLNIRTKVDIHANPLANKVWELAFNTAGKIISGKVSTIATPLFDILRNADIDLNDLVKISYGVKANTYKNIPMRYNKPESFNKALNMFDKLYSKDKEFVKWVEEMKLDILAEMPPYQLKAKNILIAKKISHQYQKMLLKFIKEFCSSFAYKGKLNVMGYFSGDKEALSLEVVQKKIEHISDRYLKTTEQDHTINDYMKQFNKNNLGIKFTLLQNKGA